MDYTLPQLSWTWRSATYAVRPSAAILSVLVDSLPVAGKIRLKDLQSILNLSQSDMDQLKVTVGTTVNKIRTRLAAAKAGVVYEIKDTRMASGRIIVVCFNDAHVVEDVEAPVPEHGPPDGDIIIPTGPYAGRTAILARWLKDCSNYLQITLAHPEGRDFFGQIVVPRIIQQGSRNMTLWRMLTLPETIKYKPGGEEWINWLHAYTLFQLIKIMLVSSRRTRASRAEVLYEGRVVRQIQEMEGKALQLGRERVIREELRNARISSPAQVTGPGPSTRRIIHSRSVDCWSRQPY